MKSYLSLNNIMDSNLFMLILLLVFTLVLFITTLYNNKRTKSNLPPSPPSLPIIGHLHLLKQPLHEHLLTISKKYGPVMLLRFGVRRVVVVTSPSAVEECFTKTNDLALANRPLLPSGKQITYNFTTMGHAPYGHLWRTLRRVAATELLSTTSLDATTHLREHELMLMCRLIVRDSWHKVDLKCWFRDLLNNITTMSIMGKRYHGDPMNISDMKQAMTFRDLMGELFTLLHTPQFGDFLPILRWIGFGGVEKKTIGFMKRIDEFLEEVIEERRRVGSCESGVMVDKLLALQKKEPELYTDQIIKGFILVMLVAGTETPYLTLEWCMSLLLNNPSALEKIKNEIDAHVGADLLQERDLDKLSYLESVINESLRLYPTLPLLLPREASDDIRIGGYLVPRGTMLMVNAWAIQRDPILWDEPNKFKPERFDRRGGGEDKYKMLAFSVGRRGCPGTNLGYRILGLTLGTLIQAFEWEKIGKEEIDMTPFYGMSMAKLKPLQALCNPRSNKIANIR